MGAVHMICALLFYDVGNRYVTTSGQKVQRLRDVYFKEMRGSGVSQPKAQSAGLVDKMSISASGLGEPQQAIFHGQ